MAPSSLATLAAFLLLIAPGLLWSMLEARWRPPVKRTSFDEISRTVLASLFATSLTALILWRRVWDPALASVPHGTTDLPLTAVVAIGKAVLATSVLGCLLTLGAHLVRRRAFKAPVLREDAWHRAFADHEPGYRPTVWVEMQDGSAWKGQVLHHDLSTEGQERRLLLEGPIARKKAGASSFERTHPRWVRLLLETKDITSIQVTFLEKAKPQESGPTTRRQRFKAWLIRKSPKTAS